MIENRLILKFYKNNGNYEKKKKLITIIIFLVEYFDYYEAQ